MYHLCYTGVKKPLLTDRHKKLRLNFARQHRNMTVDDWKRVIWSDETKINRMGSDGRLWTWVDKGHGLQDRNVQKTLKFGGGSLMVWGCFMENKIGKLRRIMGTMKATDYIEILKDSLLPSIEKFGLGLNYVTFMQDNDPKHKAKITLTWLTKKKIKTVDWPPNSPDLNPIENLWQIIKRKLILKKPVPKNVDELWDTVSKIWDSLDEQYLENLIQSLPKRISLILKAKGGHTKY